MADKEVTTAQAIEEFAPLQRLGKAIEKLNKVLQATAGAEMREKSANETVAKLKMQIESLIITADDKGMKLFALDTELVQRKKDVDREAKAYEDTETEQLNERLNGIRADIAKAEQEFEKTQSSNTSTLKRQGEEIEARNKLHDVLNKLIKKIQEPVQQIEVDKRV